jgi:hypothetical protein
MRHLANEPPRDHAEPYFLACQIRSLSVVPAMVSARSRPAQWAPGHTAPPRESDESRHERPDSNTGSHGADLPVGEPQARQTKSTDVSQSKFFGRRSSGLGNDRAHPRNVNCQRLASPGVRASISSVTMPGQSKHLYDQLIRSLAGRNGGLLDCL